ncbi:MAG: hypothetical protein JW984_15170 [Deltaproteobacteria bacterium]|uniref:Uncharacterized protein n=1 Tax=Candidatus Zymogenus saltonus TaxID=2844893 RepID=A0A9D8KGX1_9DELT|nr:hypothetical protein [Candidatus Zymogenus saltonus]
MPGKYAKRTEVPISKTKGEIEGLLEKYGAAGVNMGQLTKDGKTMALIQFVMNNLMVRIAFRLPEESEFSKTRTGQRRNKRLVEAECKRERKRIWRAVLLVIKAKLEAVESNITTFEEEFLSFLVLPDGQRVGDLVIPRLASGELPMLTEGPGQ